MINGQETNMSITETVEEWSSLQTVVQRKRQSPLINRLSDSLFGSYERK